MKRLITLFSAMALIINAHAQGTLSTVTAEDLEITPGGTGNLELYIEIDQEEYFNSYQFELELPEGVSTVPNEYSNPSFTAGNVFPSIYSFGSSNKGLYNDNPVFIGTDGQATGVLVTTYSGLLITIPLKVAETVELGTTLNCKVVNFVLAGGDLERDENLADIPFAIHAVNHMTLSELSTTPPVATEEIDVTVERTLPAETWCTIVLPFSMTADQVESAFGAGTKLASFQGYDITEDDETGDIIGITINFETETTIAANQPCLIKVTDALTSFDVDNVDVDPEDEPMINYGTNRKPKAIVGTYVAETDVPEGCLFLSGNNFYYSAGRTKMKAFRAYFDFVDMLTSAEDEIGAKIRINVAGETTSIEGIDIKGVQNGVYNLQGMFIGNDVDMNRQPKGVYIVNGKKFINK